MNEKKMTKTQLITEIKKLRDEGHYFRSVAENAPNVILIADKDGTISYINRVVQGISDTVENTIGKSIFDFIQPEYMDKVKTTVARVMETGTPDSYELVMITPQGPMWFEVMVGLIRNKKTSDSVVLITTDVTKYRQTELALRESEIKFKAAFNGATDGILIADTETSTFLLANRAICEMTGYGESEILKLGVKDIHPPESLAYVGEQFARQMRGEIKLATDLPVKRKDGSIFYADVNSAPLELQGKQCLLGVFRDMTETKKAADKLRKREKELTERVKELNCLYAVSKLVENPETSIETVLRKIVEIIPTSMQHSATACTRITLGEKEFNTDNFKETDWKLTEEFLSPDSVRGQVDICYPEDHPFLEEEKLLLKTITREIKDFLNRKKADKAQRELEAQKMVVEELRKLDRMKSEFVEIVTHELRTPMTPLRSSAEMLLDGTFGEITPEQRKYIEMMKRNIDRLSRFATEVLTFSRLESGNYVIRPTEISIMALARNAAELLGEKAKKKKTSIEIELQTESFAYADPDAVSEILTNLINNAIVHNPEGTTINISSQPNREGLIEVMVEDDGKGIPPESCARIFDKFFQSEREYGPGYKGTGIGLAVCKGLVEAMNGKIRVESEKEKGTRFIFSLPAGHPA